MAVGGHNIDALPWLVSPGAQGAGAAVRTAGERPTIVVPKDQLGQSTQIARRVVQHKPAATAPVKRTLPEALDLPQEPRLGSFLDELRGTSSLAREAPADVLERARLCECDVYVERGAGNTATVVSLGPPTKVTNVFGSSRLAESLAGGSPSSRVLFAGFEESQASAISQSAVRRHAGASSSRPGLFARSFERAKAMFGRSLDVSHSVLGLRTASGKQALVGLAPGEVASRQGLATLLAERPSWRSATVTGRKTQLVEVVFPPSGGDLGAISVRMLGEDGRALTSDKLARSVDVAIKDAARASARPAVGQVVKRLADQLTRDASVDEVQFFLKGVDTVIRLERDRASGRLVQVASVP
jgi:hypothetical protein